MTLNHHQRMEIAFALLVIAIVWSLNGIYLAALARISVLLFWAADVCQWIVLPAVLLVLLARKSSLYPTQYGLARGGHNLYTLALASIVAWGTITVAFVWPRDVLWNVLGQPTGFFSFPAVFPDGTAGAITWLYSGITAGLVESIFFIGLPWLLYSDVRRSPSPLIFTALVSVIFAMCHWEQGPHTVVGAFCSHLVGCAWFFGLGTLWPTVVGHALVDLAVFG